MSSFTESLDRKVEERIADIRSLLALGWDRERAIAVTRASSTLGPTMWNRVLEEFPDLDNRSDSQN